ncbi:MAG: CaiB/BaiF CoA transferase family protein, partial [Candidatus Rokuibacteriota bacterium]
MLEGIRVLDLSRVIAGPYCARLLADLGADVVKVERPGRGDDLRDLGGGRDGMSASYAAVNRNKRGIALDLQHPEGAKLAFELARRADVVIENFVPGAADRLGLGYEAVRAANPAVVYASVSGFGQTGPLAQRPGYNTIAQAMSGIMALTGMPGHPPTRVGGSVADLAASFVAFGAVNAALVHRLRTGQGQHLDVSLLASTLSLLPDPAALYLQSRVRPTRQGNRNPHLTPAEAFQTKDGLIIVVLMNPDQWGRFCRVLGDAGLAGDPRFATNADRLANHADLKARIEGALAAATTAEWVERFAAASIAAGPIHEFDEVFEDPQVRHLGLVTEVEQPGYGRVGMLDFPFRASAAKPAVRRPAPRLGEHTAEVLAELGLSRE